MKVLVLGATGRTGKWVVTALGDAGHGVRALHRRDVPDVDTIIAPLDDATAMARALNGCDAVVSVLASSNSDPACSTATRNLIAAASPGLRVSIVSGAGVDVPGDAKALPDRIIGTVMKLVVGRMLADRQAEYRLLAASSLRWTLIRPPRLLDGKATGRLAWRFDTPASTRLTRADLASALVESLSRDDLVGRAPFVSEERP